MHMSYTYIDTDIPLLRVLVPYLWSTRTLTDNNERRYAYTFINWTRHDHVHGYHTLSYYLPTTLIPNV